MNFPQFKFISIIALLHIELPQIADFNQYLN